MNIRNTLAALALGLASTVAMAATTPATPAAPAAAAAAPAKAKTKPVAHKAASCKQGETLVKGKCEKKAQG